MSAEPPSNVTLTDRAGLEKWQRDTAATGLAALSARISDAGPVLRELAAHDTVDCVAGGAIMALWAAGECLDDVVTALGDGRLGGGEGT
jgi:hypothetical protein